MNNMKKVSIVWGIVVIIVFGLLTAFGFFYKNKSKVYKDLEEKLVQAEEKYVDAKFLYPDGNETLKTSADLLISEGYLENLKVNDEECKGYATVHKNGVAYEYKGFVSCQNYKTKGYEK